MPAPTITPLPTPPSRSTDPANFAIEADAFVAALPEFATDANAQADYLDDLAAGIDVTIDDFEVYVASQTSVITGYVSDASGFADDAEASAVSAAASASAAEAASNASAWVSGATYAIGDVVYSLINYQSYRRITNGGGTTDPVNDLVNWVQLGGVSTGKAIAMAIVFGG
jgi:hypothetical protein